ncbi:MAG TPA: glycosyltransferase family 39 protein [Polyangia bacterium]|nr:glycosyltransferase family 39 protein [Polyangia bacterium]
MTDSLGDREGQVVPRTGVAALLATAALLCVHGRRLAQNLAQAQWEDGLFFRYTRQHIHTLVDCFRRPGPYPGLYRPLTTNLFYLIGLRVFGEKLVGYHLICILLVVLNATLLYRIAFRLLHSRWALLAPIAFASRLANAEVVTHSCEFQTLFSVFWALACLDWFMQRRFRRSVVALVLALASKETALVTPVILIAYGFLFDREPKDRRSVGHLAVAGLWVMTLLAFHDRATGFRYDLSPSNVLGNLAAYLLAFFNPLVWPLDDWVMPPSVRTAASWPLMQAAMAALMAICLVSFPRLASRARLVAFGFAWFVIATLPAAIFEGRLFMRYGYFGYAGLSIAAAAAGALVGEATRDWRRRPGARAAAEGQSSGAKLRG